MAILPTKPFDLTVPVLVIGGGSCGLVAALAAHDAGAEVLVLERDAVPSGSTALSSGFIPACGTRWQTALDVADDVSVMGSDIMAKAKGQPDPAQVEAVCTESGPTLEWLADAHDQPFILLDDFLYPGHSVHRMHAHPDKTGAALVGSLLGAVERAGIEVVCGAHVTDLFAEPDGMVTGARVTRPDGTSDDVGCEAVVLACNGYGGNPEMVAIHIPEMADAQYFGHVGNQGDAVIWGTALGAATRHLTAYQGHGSVATPHGILITWALMMEGGIQLNTLGRRFSNEHQGYSEQSVAVLAQPGGVAFDVYDARLHELGMTFPDYRGAVDAGAVKTFESLEDLAAFVGAPVAEIEATLRQCAAAGKGHLVDPFGRDFTGADPLEGPPWYAVKVTGALFHTQGGLTINTEARVLREDGTALPNLLAGGGAAVGVSGARVEGYLSGNGLLTALTLGRIAGRTAAGLIASK